MWKAYLSVCSASSSTLFLELGTSGLQHTWSTCNPQKMCKTIPVLKTIHGFFLDPSHYCDSSIFVIFFVTQSSRHRLGVLDQSPEFSSRSLRWLPCWRASSLCAMDWLLQGQLKRLKPVYDACRMNVLEAPHDLVADLEFVKKFTRPNFRARKFYTLKTRKLRLFSPAINSDNASLSVIWASFG